jgi:5-hydroxyisourate hydrolase-like protein (transthyretin family)
MDDVKPLLEAFVAGAFPWISQFKALKIHFEIEDFDVSSISNFFASLFAVAIFGFFQYLHPSQLSLLLYWQGFIVGALVLTVIFISIFFYYRKEVNCGNKKHIVILNLAIYILIFCSLTTGFSLLRVYKPYYVVQGKVLDEITNKGIENLDISIFRKVDDEKTQYSTTKTESDGDFVILIKKEDADKVNLAEFNNGQYNGEAVFSGESGMFSTMKIFKLGKEPKNN